MAKKLKKFLKKAGKAAAVAAALYGATKLGRRKSIADMDDAGINVKHFAPDDYNYTPKRATPDFDMNVPYAMSAKGGRIGAKKGGHVKSMGIAKRGGGVAKR
jgi:hypothetical protein